MISMVIILADLPRRADQHRSLPLRETRRGPSRATSSRSGSTPSAPRQQRARSGLPAGEYRVITGFSSSSPTPSTSTSSWRQSTSASLVAPALGASTRPRHGHGEREPRTRLRVGQGGGLHLEADAPDFATCTGAGAASRCAAWTPASPQPKLLIMGLARQHVRLGRPLLSGEASGRRRDVWCRRTIDPTCLVVHHVAAAASSMPGRHRARGRHHRHAPLRGPGWSRGPLQASLLLRNMEIRGPVGFGSSKRTEVARPRSTSRCPSSTARFRRLEYSTGSVRGFARRARPQAGRVDREDACTVPG